MKTDKIIININNLNEIDEYKKIGITNFLFAIEKFSIVEPKCIDGVPDIYGKISPLFFYCNKCGNTFSLSSSNLSQ